MLRNWLNIFKRSALPSTVQDMRMLWGGPGTASGVSVTEEIAMGQAAVFRAVSLKASTIASLNRFVYQETDDRGCIVQPKHYISKLLRDPNDDQNANKFWRAFITSVEASGNAYAEIERMGNGRPIGLHFIHWRCVTLKIDDYGSLYYEVRQPGQGTKTIQAADMLHVTGQSWDGLVGISPILANRESLAIGIAADRHAASVFGNGAVPRGALKIPGNPNEETKEAIKEAWDFKHGGLKNANKPALLINGMEWISTNMSPEDCQLLETRAFSIEEVARIWGVPPNLLFAGKESYSANEEANIQFYELGLLPTLDNLEAELDHKLLTREERAKGFSVNHKVDALLRGVFQAKAKTAVSLKVAGIWATNEARIYLGSPPKDEPGADELLHPTNLQKAKDGEGGTEVEPIDTQQDPEPKPGAPEKERAVSLVRDALVDQIARGLRRQVKGKPDLRQHRNYLQEALEPSYRAYQQATGLEVELAEFTQRWVDFTSERGVEQVKVEEILGLLEVGQ